MAETQRPKEIIYICLDGKFIPKHLMQNQEERDAYLAGYQLEREPAKSSNPRLNHLFRYGASIASSNTEHLIKRKDGTYVPRKLREPKSFPEGLVKDDIGILGTRIASERNLFTAPAWAFPNHSETSE